MIDNRKIATNLNYIGLLILFLAIVSCKNEEKSIATKKEKRPNIIYVYVDQLSANMMSNAGNDYLKTPALDYIAHNGIRFTRAYTTNPVCSPARVSLMTGRFPSYFKDDKENEVRENRGSMMIPTVTDEVKRTTIAAHLKKANYDLYFGGKEHLPKSLTPAALGFNKFSNDERGELVKKAADIIKENHENPYFMVVSLINPHDICYMALREKATSKNDAILLKRAKVELATLDKAMKIPEGVSKEEFYASYCPPLPVNYEPQIDEPRAVKNLIDNRPFRKNAREHFTDQDWKHHRYAYHRLTEVMDKEIQVLLDAIKNSGQEENTLIIFSSDHGDMSASHRMEHKSTLYEESANIPFMAMWKGHIPKGQINEKNLISNGLDLLPTICDYAGIEGVSDHRGRSLQPLFQGEDVSWRETLGVESEIGKMVVDQHGFKYMRYDVDGIEEQLLNLDLDPFETTHFTDDLRFKSDLERLRKIYQTEWFK
ncbi:sulfatase [Nonlabens arenilitoris]|uniref:Sulfatase n=1 Tax=Nonlabens arenilitoris TaxID=1217969 RepID=A0A2S7U8N6_9FLAO|nr:sulfatase-like hydrolase/transferase [Nonlabens arenilitoris]PQJ30744.1 sulfatase [Nonlabens arenilitoris]